MTFDVTILNNGECAGEEKEKQQGGDLISSY